MLKGSADGFMHFVSSINGACWQCMRRQQYNFVHLVQNDAAASWDCLATVLSAHLPSRASPAARCCCSSRSGGGRGGGRRAGRGAAAQLRPQVVHRAQRRIPLLQTEN